MTTKPSVGSYQHVLLPLFLLFCFGGVFYTYYKPTVSWFSCSNVPVSSHEVCSDECLKVLTANFTQNTTTHNYTTQKLLLPQPTPKPADTEENITFLIWTWPFGYKFDVKACPRFGIEGCQLTDDRSQYDKAHGVLFHHRDIGGDFTELLKRPRPPHQKWVWMNMESPDNSGRNDRFDAVFNLTTNYRRDSDVWVPCGRIIEISEKDKPFKIPPKDKLVCWIVSHWNPNFRRVKFFNELSKHIKIEAYGRHFNRHISSEEYRTIVSGCKFYLSFENSIHKDYFTEKLFNPLIIGTVPVVLGPSRENYEEFIPGDAFIHVDDFKSPQELAERLKFLDQNQEVYERYFTWRQHFTAIRAHFGLEHACRSCHFIKRNKSYRVFKNLNKWYWG
ncbi:4-galactosyl-N-acetylglucosaminide 3-alpha-L-fucosyltransferase 9-like [Hemibagrus wyckioides]|uniref:4-galactosyl-N-acetylglucosaminide 3-alpha-L-fucosyltransferase 9-like n=1 Tax=Hemibagrus wyckioides TaxID=337641 RepID=UPI00266C4226|nr:4-galactosyl-N-acetylglucosaminide 3-alpha-L-fucosyltransferase 9-like [Hemibagrus wyckioides]XP_058264329.1 4-galactosyl-N-acetylglucosaminide 3-alpha-L-fucosyltransferase 9-like [Hemibagrus wyckioides]